MSPGSYTQDITSPANHRRLFGPAAQLKVGVFLRQQGFRSWELVGPRVRS